MRPSVAPWSPLERSRSTGPQPFVELMNGRSLTYCTVPPAPVAVIFTLSASVSAPGSVTRRPTGTLAGLVYVKLGLAAVESS